MKCNEHAIFWQGAPKNRAYLKISFMNASKSADERKEMGEGRSVCFGSEKSATLAALYFLRSSPNPGAEFE